jgi:hypothetical protein
MTPASADDDHMEDADGDEGPSGDIIARAKGMDSEFPRKGLTVY